MKRIFLTLILILFFTSTAIFSQEIKGVIYQGTVEEAVFYTQGIGLLKGSFSVPTGGEISVILTPTLIPDTLSIVDNQQKVTTYYLSQNLPEIKQGQEYRVSWKSSATGEHKVELRYLVRDINWLPSYSLGILDESNVYLIYGVIIKNNAVDLKNINLKLISGEIGEVVPIPPVGAMFKEKALESEAPAAFPTQQLNVYHLYDLGVQNIPKDCDTYLTLAEGKLSAKRIFVWDTREGEKVDVIYKIVNSFNRPWAEGIVRIYEKGIFMGSDVIKWTPVGTEAEVTMGATSDVRVKKSETTKKITEKENRYRYKYFTELEIKNYTEKEIKIKVIEPKYKERESYKFKIQPEESGDLFQWEIKVPPQSTEIISYESQSQLFW